MGHDQRDTSWEIHPTSGAGGDERAKKEGVLRGVHSKRPWNTNNAFRRRARERDGPYRDIGCKITLFANHKEKELCGDTVVEGESDESHRSTGAL